LQSSDKAGSAVSTKGDLVDHADDIGDFVGGLFDPAHRFDVLSDNLTGRRGAGVGLACDLAGLLGAFGRRGEVGRGRYFVQRSCRLFQGGRLLFGASREVIRTVGDLVRSSIDADCRTSSVRQSWATAVLKWLRSASKSGSNGSLIWIVDRP
jgi:hypothetical protein